MTKLFEFTFLDIYNQTYIISIYDSEGTTQGNVLTAKLYGQDGFILNYKKENIDIVQGGIIKSDVTFSVVNENGVLDNFLKKLQSYENRYLVDIFYNERLFWRGIMLNDYITFDDSKIQVIKFSCTDGLGVLQNIDYTDDIDKSDSTTMQFDSDAYGNGLIDVISRALSFNPVTKFLKFNERYINYRTDYIADEMLNDWDALVYTNILKHKADTTLLVSPFADYKIKETLAGNRLKVYEYKNCYDVINECLKVFNLCLCQRYGVWYIFNIRDFEKNKDNFILNSVNFAHIGYYKNIRNKDLKESVVNNYFSIGGNNSNKRGDGEFGLNTVVKKIEQKYVPYYVKEGTFNNLIYSGNHGGDLQWYSYPAGVVTGISNGNTVYESNFNDWLLCSKYHYHNELDIFTAMTKLQFLINFTIKYTLSAGSGHVHTSMIKPKMDLNLRVNGKWLDSNGNWVDNLPSDNWWHKFTGVFEGYDRCVIINFSKYFDLLIPNQNSGKLVVDFYFRIYTKTNVISPLPWNFKITNIENNSVLKLVDNNGNDIESIDYVVENDSGILDLELEQAFIDNFGESEENNVLFTAVQDLGRNSYRYKKSKKWRHSDETNYYNLVELRLREIAAMNNHPLLNWQGTIYYDKDTNVNYMLFYLIKYNLTLQNYVMFPQRWTFYARKRYAEADLIEVSKDFVRVISGNDLAITDFNLPMVPINSGTGTIVTADEGVVIVPANRINLAANDTVNEIINVSRQNGSTDFIVEYDEDNQEINWKNNTETLLKITNDGISYKNEKTAGSGIEIDSNNKINVKIDNDTIKIDSNNKLYANINEIVRYMQELSDILYNRYIQDNVSKYDKVTHTIVECFLDNFTEIEFPDYSYFKGIYLFPVEYIEDFIFENIIFTGNFKMDNLKIVSDGAFYYSNFSGTLSLPVCEQIGGSAFAYSNFSGELNLPVCKQIGNRAFEFSNFSGSLNLPACTYIGYNAFLNSNFSGSLNLPACEYIGYGAFYSSNFSGSLNLPVCTQIGGYAFLFSNFSLTFFKFKTICVTSS